MPPQEAKLEQVFPENIKKFLPYKPLEGDNQIASFTHLTGYSSAVYTYLWDKVIAEDFYSQFNPNDLLAPEVALRYRSKVLDVTGYMPANDLVKSFLGRPAGTGRVQGLDEPGVPEHARERKDGGQNDRSPASLPEKRAGACSSGLGRATQASCGR